jgi:hypothetical protein
MNLNDSYAIWQSHMAEPWLASIFDGSRARPQVTFSLVFGVFAVIGYISFGAKMEAFSTITGSLHFIYKMAQGELDMEGLHDAGGILGLIYYYAFTMMVRPRARARITARGVWMSGMPTTCPTGMR